MFEVSVESYFSAAHHLREYQGKCENLHGHNWKVSVSVIAGKLDGIGIIIDFRELKKKLNEALDSLDHTCLNELAYFKEVNPTSENIAGYIYSQLSRTVNHGEVRVSKVSVWETEASGATYYE